MQNLQEMIDNLTVKQLRELRQILNMELFDRTRPDAAAKPNKDQAAERPVLITTEHRGVFFGYTTATDEEILATKSARVRNIRNCVYWSAELKGFGGLVTSGPSKSCKIGPAMPSAMVLNVTGAWDCTPEAAKAWETAPWDK